MSIKFQDDIHKLKMSVEKKNRKGPYISQLLAGGKISLYKIIITIELSSM